MSEEPREAELSGAWRAALEEFDHDLSARSAAERTRRAYRTDAAQLAAWAGSGGSSRPTSAIANYAATPPT